MSTRRQLLAALAGLAFPTLAAASTPPVKKDAKTPAKKDEKKPDAKKAAKKPAAKKVAQKKRLIIRINKVSQKMTVELDGKREYTWPVSTGAPGYETPSGAYTPFRMEAEHFSKEWDDAPMPHSIFFTGRGHAVHGSYHIKSLGRRASHGCVRLHPDNAAKLFALVQKTGLSNTQVEVRGGFFDGFGGSKKSNGDSKRNRLFPWQRNEH
ncbi:MAG: L,D-transpeptidase [Alphaproteobacteria bacterium]|nr:L,D-transpeptidase [Alphaproteobacteria bacterium]